MRNERAWPQQCWKSCANGSNVVALRLGDHGTKEMLGVVDWKVWPVSNFAQQHATTSNNMQQGVQTDATCNIQQCWKLLADNVASVCTGLYVYGNLSKLPWSPFTQSSTVWHTAITFSSEGVWTKCCVVFRLLLTAIFHSVLVRNILVNPNLFLLWNCDRGVWMSWKYMA